MTLLTEILYGISYIFISSSVYREKLYYNSQISMEDL